MSWEIDRSAIGQWGPETTMRVEYGKLREFARAIKDDNAAFAGDEALAPPTFLMTIAHWTEGATSGEKQGSRGGKMLFVLMESEYRNQRDEVVAYSRNTLIMTEGTVKA